MMAAGTTPAAPKIILAFDYGTRRMGVASGDDLTRTARALATLDCASGIPWSAIDRLVDEYRPQQFVVGLPYNMDGTPTPLAKASRRFGVELKSRYAQPVALIDERLSSREAAEQIRSARAKGLKHRRATHADVDKVAARIVLERWLENESGSHNV